MDRIPYQEQTRNLMEQLTQQQAQHWGTVAGALAALVFLFFSFCVFRKAFKKQMKYDTEHVPRVVNYCESTAFYDCTGYFKRYRIEYQ